MISPVEKKNKCLASRSQEQDKPVFTLRSLALYCLGSNPSLGISSPVSLGEVTDLCLGMLIWKMGMMRHGSHVSGCKMRRASPFIQIHTVPTAYQAPFQPSEVQPPTRPSGFRPGCQSQENQGMPRNLCNGSEIVYGTQYLHMLGVLSKSPCFPPRLDTQAEVVTSIGLGMSNVGSTSFQS